MHLNPLATKDDPHFPAILVVYSQVAEVLKENFLIYLPQIFTKIVDAAK